MSVTRFVPRPRAPANCQIVIPALDDALFAARESLLSAIHGNNTQTIDVAFTQYESVAAEVANVYCTMNAMQREIQQAVDSVCFIVNEHMSRMLNDSDQTITKSCRAIEMCESALALFGGAIQNPAGSYVQQIEQVCTSLIHFVNATIGTNAELAAAITGAESVCSLAWRQHAYTTTAKLHSHSRCEIPATMRKQLMNTMGRGWSIRAESALADAAWNHFNQTPLGVKLGMFARYACDNSNLMLEQLLVEPRYSLFDESVHRRLTQMLYEKPNSSLARSCHIPLLALAYSLRLKTPDSDQDFVDCITNTRSTTLLYSAVAKRCDALLPKTITTDDESRNFKIPHAVAFFSIADVFAHLAQEIEIDGTSRCNCTTDAQRSLYDMMRCLVFFKGNETKLLLVSRLWFWSRYANGEGADEMQFWKWSLKKEALKRDLAAFRTERSFLAGNQWKFYPESIS